MSPLVVRAIRAGFQTATSENGALQGDDDFSSSVSAFDVTEGRRGLVQRVRFVEDRCELPGFDKLLENDQILMIRDRKIPAQVLAHLR